MQISNLIIHGIGETNSFGTFSITMFFFSIVIYLGCLRGSYLNFHW